MKELIRESLNVLLCLFKLVIDFISGIVQEIIHSFTTFNPNPDSLSDIASFASVVIALAIPLSLQIVSTVSDRYRSEIIAKKFFEASMISWLTGCLIFNVFLAISLEFFMKDPFNSVFWKIFSWTAYVGFIVSAGFLINFLNQLRHYMMGIELIINELFKEANELFKD